MFSDQFTVKLQHIDNICKQYGISYLVGGNGNGESQSQQMPITDLFKPDTKIYEGHNRHEALLRAMESLISRNKAILSPEIIKELVIKWNNDHCLPPLDNKEIERQWKCAIDFIAKRNDNDNKNGSTTKNTNTISPEEQEEQLLAEKKLTSEDIDFVISTIKKEAQYDEISIKQLLYGMSSAFTKVPIPHIVNSKDPGAGKSYLLNLVSEFFPDKYVMPMSGMSDKALFHRKGVLVIENQNKETGELELEPIAPIIDPLVSETEELEEQIQDEKDKDPKSRDKRLIRDNKRRIRVIESQIDDIKSLAEKLIDLNNKIIILLDTPQDSLYDALMSIISQDTPRDQQYSFVEKSGSSGKLGTRNNILRGVPVLFTAQVIDDTRKMRYAEKNRRFVHVTPDTSNEKIQAAKRLIGHRHGLLEEEYDKLVVSRHDKDKAKQIVKILVAKLKQHSKHFQPKRQGVKTPFEATIMDSIPNDLVWDMTVAERTVKYLSIITKINMDSRPKLVNEETGKFYPISTFEDLKETLKLMQVGASGVRPYIAIWYNKVFVPSYDKLGGKPNEDKKEIGKDDDVIILKEKYPGLNTNQLSEKTKEILGGRKISSEELISKYLYPLINQGIIEEVQSEIDKRRKIYLPVEQGNLFSIFGNSSSKDLRLKVSNPDIFPSKNFLKEQFRMLSNYRYSEEQKFEKNISCYKLIDSDGTEITLDRLLEKYFTNPEDCFIFELHTHKTNTYRHCTIYAYQIKDENISIPTLVITGTEDVSVPSANSLIIVQKSQELGLCRLKVVDMD